MWLITRFGAFSIVHKPEDSIDVTLTVRARVRTDLETFLNLAETHNDERPEILEDVGTDYRYRARVSERAVASVLQELVLHIDYGNFKNKIHDEQGAERARIYSRVWSDLLELEGLS